LFYLRKPLELSPKAWELTPKLMEITPKAMEIEYIRIKRLNLEKEKTYAIGCDMIDIHLFRR
jgi:hypothetical protein